MQKPRLRHISFSPLLRFPGQPGENASVIHAGTVFDSQLSSWRVVLSSGGLVALGHAREDSTVIGVLPVHLPDGSLPAYIRAAGHTSVPLGVRFIRQELANLENGPYDSLPNVQSMASRTINPDDPPEWVIEVPPGWNIPSGDAASSGWQAGAAIDNARFWYGIFVETHPNGESDRPEAALTGATIGYYESFG